MAEVRDIKDRISSVKKTKKITQAMKMVAAAKFKRAMDSVVKVRPYVSELQSLLAQLVESEQGNVDSVFFQPNGASKEAVVIISGDRGLCGGFNTAILKYAQSELSGKDADIFVLGNKASQYFSSRLSSTTQLYKDSLHTITVKDMESIIAPVKEGFINGTYGKVTLFYNEFVSAAQTKAISSQLLPLSVNSKSKADPSDTIYEPNKDSVMDLIVSDYLTFTLYKGLLESRAGEEGSRMTAMDAATGNATEMIKDLTLVYNRTRQAQITTELSEIVAGAAAQAG